MRAEYDFRFAGLGIVSPKSLDNTNRVRRVRDSILRIAGGFTEIPPEACADLIPGEGMGYIVALPSRKIAHSLQIALGCLANAWGLAPPKLQEAGKGPRRAYFFFLIPEKANSAGSGAYRRPLFRLSRWARIDDALGKIAKLRVEHVYGEWMPARSSPVPVRDDSRMYIVPRGSATQRDLVRFIRTHIFDKGIECDQECIYLSCGGIPMLVQDK